MAGVSHAFLVQVRFADGSRAKRRPLRDAPLATLKSQNPKTLAGASHAFLVQVRFADGSRATRRFLRDAPLAAVRSLCIARQPEAARGRAFVLSTMGLPGACGRLWALP